MAFILNQYIFNVPVTTVGATDPDVDAYLTNIYNAGANLLVTAPTITAFDTWASAGQTHGWWSKTNQGGFFIWNNAGANAIKFYSSANSVFNGTGTHSNKNYTGNGSTGYNDTNFNPGSLTAASSTAVYSTTSEGVGGNLADMLVRGSGGTPSYGLFHFTGTVYHDSGDSTGGRTSASNTSRVGMFLGSNLNGTGRFIKRRSPPGITTLYSGAGTNSGSMPVTNLYVGASNENGVVSFISDRSYTHWFALSGLTNAEADHYLNDTWTLLQTLDATGAGPYYTLPTTNLAYDYDFGQPSTITASSNSISAISNNSAGVGNNLVQATGTSQPTLIETAGPGLWTYARFDGSSDYLKSTASITLNKPITVYLVARMLTYTGNRYIYDSFGSVQASLSYASGTAIRIGSGGVHGTPTSNQLPVSTWGIVTAVFNGASSELRINKLTTNSVSLSAGSAPNGLTLGTAGNNSLANTANFDCARIVCYSAAHNTTDQNTIIDGLAAQYKISV